MLFFSKNQNTMSKNISPYGLLGERSKPPALFYCHETIAIDLLLENFIAAARGIPAVMDKDGQGEYYELEVSPAFYQEFRRLELNNKKIQNWDQRHREFSEVWDETLNRRARVTRKSWSSFLKS